jgi:hypothetical protein
MISLCMIIFNDRFAVFSTHLYEFASLWFCDGYETRYFRQQYHIGTYVFFWRSAGLLVE